MFQYVFAIKQSDGHRKRWPGLTNPYWEHAMASRIEENAVEYDPPAGAAAEMHAAPRFIRDSEIQFSRTPAFHEGQRVSFDIEIGPDGEPIAVNIKPI